MNLPTYFSEFTGNILPTDSQTQELQHGHQTLRERLMRDGNLKEILIATFLQGSYIRHTIVRPRPDKHLDVDIIVVTNLDRNDPENVPSKVYNRFQTFLDKYYPKKWQLQGRSIGIKLSNIDLDLVITSAPSEVMKSFFQEAKSLQDAALHEDIYNLIEKAAVTPRWKDEPLWIPDRELKEWRRTHPLEQIRWTKDKNQRTNGHFINIVRAIKWWKQAMQPNPEHPKGFPLERIVGDCSPDEIKYVDDGITVTLEAIVRLYAMNFSNGTVPDLRDYGVSEHNVLSRISADEFSMFYQRVRVAASTARRALDATDIRQCVTLWRELLGDRFPEPPKDTGGGSKGGSDQRGGGFTPPERPAKPTPTRYAITAERC